MCTRLPSLPASNYGFVLRGDVTFCSFIELPVVQIVLRYTMIAKIALSGKIVNSSSMTSSSPNSVRASGPHSEL